jgi:hypothetical protein
LARKSASDEAAAVEMPPFCPEGVTKVEAMQFPITARLAGESSATGPGSIKLTMRVPSMPQVLPQPPRSGALAHFLGRAHQGKPQLLRSGAARGIA